MLWRPNRKSFDFSRMYDAGWADKLYRGVARHCAEPFRFVCYTDGGWTFGEPIEQKALRQAQPDYGACIEPFAEPGPLIVMGLDTIITGDLAPLIAYAKTADRLALPRDPFYPATVCNGVALVPPGHEWIAAQHDGQNDMQYLRGMDAVVLDDALPGLVVSYKGHVIDKGLGDARIVYFHGEAKAHELDHDWIKEHWR